MTAAERQRKRRKRLMNRPQLQRDIFPSGNPEAIAEIKHLRFTATLFDLLTAYAETVTRRMSRNRKRKRATLCKS